MGGYTRQVGRSPVRLEQCVHEECNGNGDRKGGLEDLACQEVSLST